MNPRSRVTCRATGSPRAEREGRRARAHAASGIAGALVLLLGAAGCAGDPPGEVAALEAELERLGRVDPALLRYHEADRLQVDLDGPRALAVGPDGRVWVGGIGGVVGLDDGRTTTRISVEGSVTCLAADPDLGLVLGLGDHLAVVDPSGGAPQHWPAAGPRAHLTSVAVAADRVAAADAGTATVVVYDRGGRVIGRVGEVAPEQDPAFVVPSPYFDLAFGHGGLLWVVDPGRHLVVGHGPTGKTRSTWGRGGAAVGEFCGCCNPTHLAVMAGGRFVTSEKGLVRVKIYRPSGELEAVVAGPESFAEGAVGLDLAVDRAGRVLVLDPGLRMVRVFAPKRDGSGA